MILSDDTDVLVLCLAFKSFIPSTVYTKCGTQARTRYIDTTHVVQRHGSELCRCLPGLHAFTGLWQCKRLFRVRKTVCIELKKRHVKFRELFQASGTEWEVSNELFTRLQAVYLLHVQLKSGNQWCKWPAVPSLLHQERRPRLQLATTMRRHSAQALRLGQLPGCDMAPKPPELPADTLFSWPWVKSWGMQADS